MFRKEMFVVLLVIPFFLTLFLFSFLQKISVTMFAEDVGKESIDGLFLEKTKIFQDFQKIYPLLNIPIENLKFNIYARNNIWVLEGDVQRRPTLMDVSVGDFYTDSISTQQIKKVYERAVIIEEFLDIAPLQVKFPNLYNVAIGGDGSMSFLLLPTSSSFLMVYLLTSFFWYEILSWFNSIAKNIFGFAFLKWLRI